MAKLNKHYRALDHVIVALDLLSNAKPVTAAAELQKALACADYREMIQTLDTANEPTAKPTLAQALTIVAAKSKDAKKKKAKKKAKAAASTKGLVIAELEVENLDLTEDDLLDDGDELSADVDAEGEGEDGDDLDLDALELDEDDDGDEATAADEDLDEDGEDDDDQEMPEATSADALGTDDEIKPGSEGAPKTNDAGEPPTTVTKEAVPPPADGPSTAEAKTQTKAARRLLANIQAIEVQSAKIKTVTKPVTAKPVAPKKK